MTTEFIPRKRYAPSESSAKIREILKAEFPEIKFSVRLDGEGCRIRTSHSLLMTLAELDEFEAKVAHALRFIVGRVRYAVLNDDQIWGNESSTHEVEELVTRQDGSQVRMYHGLSYVTLNSCSLYYSFGTDGEMVV